MASQMAAAASVSPRRLPVPELALGLPAGLLDQLRRLLGTELLLVVCGVVVCLLWLVHVPLRPP